MVKNVTDQQYWYLHKKCYDDEEIKAMSFDEACKLIKQLKQDEKDNHDSYVKHCEEMGIRL